MIKTLQFILFIGIFFLISLALNSYVFFRLSGMLSLPRNSTFYILLVGLSLSFIVSTILVRTYYNIFTKIFYTLSSIYVGVIFIALCSLMVYEVVRIFSNVSPHKAGMMILVFVAIIALISIINAQLLITKVVEIPDFPAELKAVHLTDIHIGTIHNSGYLKRIVDKVNGLEPEVIFITGDLVSGGSKIRPGMFDELKNFKAPVYFVNGNHEHYDGVEEIQKMLKEQNINSLNDEVVEFKGIQIVGVDYSLSSKYLQEVWSNLKVSEKKPTILLMHAPIKEGYPRVDLVLSGHTHGGQIVPFNLLARLVMPYVKGLYNLNDGHIYVSQGTGTWGPPMRLGTNNEITLLKLGS